MNRKILVPLDGTPDAERAVLEARRLASGRAEIHLLHDVPMPAPPVGMEPTRLLDLPERARPYLEDVRARLLEGAPGLDHVRSGAPADSIIQVALELNVDLLAMSTHARRGLARWFLGSVAESVLRKTRLPVLLVPPGARPARTTLRRILVALDGSDTSMSILDAVKPLALGSGAEVILLHVAPKVLDPSPQWATREPIAMRKEPGHRFQELADRLEEEHGDLVAWPVVAWGDPVEEILAQAKAQEADLVALATHGRSGLQRVAAGSVAEGVIQRSDRAVLVQKPPALRE
jgi:nucleotide-binding universal stress UspA family protein